MRGANKHERTHAPLILTPKKKGVADRAYLLRNRAKLRPLILESISIAKTKFCSTAMPSDVIPFSFENGFIYISLTKVRYMFSLTSGAKRTTDVIATPLSRWGKTQTEKIMDSITMQQRAKGTSEFRAKMKARDKELAQRAKNPYAEGSRYYELYENNPYNMDKFTRQRTGWDEFVENLGFRSGYESARDEWLKAQSEYDAQIAQLKSEDEYNSEQAKAARMRGAGLNPDLQGIGDASEAGEFTQEQTSPDVNRNSEDVEKVVGVIEMIPKAIMFMYGMAEKGVALSAASADLKGKVYDNTAKISTLVNSFLDNFTVAEYAGEGNEFKKFDFNEIANLAKKSATMWAKENGFTEREQKIFTTGVSNAIYGGRKADMYKKWRETIESRNEYGKVAGSKYNTRSDDADQINIVLGDLVKDLDKALQEGTKAKAKEAENERKNQENLDPVLKAEGENARNQTDKDQGEIRKAAREAFKVAMDKLEKYTKDGNTLASIMMSVVAALQLKAVE